MASGPITLWQIEGGKVEAVSDVFSWTSKSPQTVTTVMEDPLEKEMATHSSILA